MKSAWSLIIGLDKYLLSIISVSLRVSLGALLISGGLSAISASLLHFLRFPGRRYLQAFVYTGMGVPSVIVGLITLMALSEQGPLGPLELLWTPSAMIISQTILITPLVTGIMLSSLESVDESLYSAAVTLGATKPQRVGTVFYEARYGFLTAVLAGFGRAISEVGSVILVGGNIVWSNEVSYTRTLTTAVVVETRKGNFEMALALGMVLVFIVLGVNVLANRLKGPNL